MLPLWALGVNRYKPGHVPDLFRHRESRIAACSCGFMAATLDEVRAHASSPAPEPTPMLVRMPDFLYDLTPAGRNAQEGRPFSWHPKRNPVRLAG